MRGFASRVDIPNELDLPNIVEEIEDVGNSQLRAVGSYMRLILSHLVLIATDADADSIGHRTREVATFRGEFIQAWQRSMRQRIDIDRIWRNAVDEAALKLSTYHGHGAAFGDRKFQDRLGSASLVDIDDMGGETFAFHDLVARLRACLAPENPR